MASQPAPVQDPSDEDLMDQVQQGQFAFWTLMKRHGTAAVEVAQQRFRNLGDENVIAAAAWDKVKANSHRWDRTRFPVFKRWFLAILRNCAIVNGRSLQCRPTVPLLADAPFRAAPDFDYVVVAEVLLAVRHRQKPRDRNIIRTRYWGDPGDPEYDALDPVEGLEFEGLLQNPGGKTPSLTLALWIVEGFVNRGRQAPLQVPAERYDVSVPTVSNVCRAYYRQVAAGLNSDRKSS